MTSHMHDSIVYRVDTYIEDSCSPGAHLDSICIACPSINTMSSGGNEGRSYEMDDINVVVVTRQPDVVVVVAAQPMSFKNMFKTILKAYDDEREWWVAVEKFLENENEDFAAKVKCSSVYILTCTAILHVACR